MLRFVGYYVRRRCRLRPSEKFAHGFGRFTSLIDFIPTEGLIAREQARDELAACQVSQGNPTYIRLWPPYLRPVRGESGAFYFKNVADVDSPVQSGKDT